MLVPDPLSVSVVAGVHPHSGGVHVVIAELGPTAGGAAAVRSVRLAQSFANEEQASAAIAGASPEAIVRVLAGGQTVARVASLPPGGDDRSRLEAIALMAETDLAADLPAYRRAWGLVMNAGLLVGWPERAEPDSASDDGDIPEVCVGDVAAWGLLADMVGGLDLVASADASTGTVSVLGTGPERAVARAVVLEADDEFSLAAADIAREVAVATGLDPQRVPTRIEGVFTSPELSSATIAGASRTSAFLATFGPALAAVNAYAERSTLVRLYRVEPRHRGTAIARASAWFARPAIAATLVLASLGILLALPIGVSYARVRILDKAITNQTEITSANERDERELVFYRLLRERRWPMTKLMADIAGATPVGVLVETLDLAQGEGVTLRGTAEKLELVAQLRENLTKTRVFSEVSMPTSTPSGGSVQFTLQAKVAPGGATYNAKPIDDFAAKPLVQRLYGEGATSTDRRIRRSEAAGKKPSAGSSPASGPASAGTSRPSSSGGGRSTEAKAPTVPPPISDAEIAKLDQTGAMMEFAKRRSASSQPGLDEATRNRLKEESAKAQQRMREAMNAGQKGGG